MQQGPYYPNVTLRKLIQRMAYKHLEGIGKSSMKRRVYTNHTHSTIGQVTTQMPSDTLPLPLETEANNKE